MNIQKTDSVNFGATLHFKNFPQTTCPYSYYNEKRLSQLVKRFEEKTAKKYPHDTFTLTLGETYPPFTTLSGKSENIHLNGDLGRFNPGAFNDLFSLKDTEVINKFIKLFTTLCKKEKARKTVQKLCEQLSVADTEGIVDEYLISSREATQYELNKDPILDKFWVFPQKKI